MKGISLFSSGGIGDLAFKANKIDIVVANELLEMRSRLHKRNFPHTKIIIGDIWKKKEEIIRVTREALNGETLDFVFATPPCQGMSKNGQGKLLQGIREGKKTAIDSRNRLIIPTVEIILALKPRIVFLENVPEMLCTIINDETDTFVNIIDYIKKSLEPEYIGKAEVINFADYGVPQRRQRLITVFTKDDSLNKYFNTVKTFMPPKTHSIDGRYGLKKWVTLRDKISGLPPLDGKNKESANSGILYHRVPVLDPKKYIWISHTPPEKSAFDNQCINPNCLYQSNRRHGAKQNEHGINKFNTDTPLYCQNCGALLPRPYTINKDGSLRIMSGYTSAYKRMSWDLPASTLTTNLSYPSSDHKIHPEQNRVLSLYEAFILHTLDKFEFTWEIEENTPANDTLITEVIGESVPPFGIYLLVKHLIDYSKKREIIVIKPNKPTQHEAQLRLPY